MSAMIRNTAWTITGASSSRDFGINPRATIFNCPQDSIPPGWPGFLRRPWPQLDVRKTGLSTDQAKIMANIRSLRCNFRHREKCLKARTGGGDRPIKTGQRRFSRFGAPRHILR